MALLLRSLGSTTVSPSDRWPIWLWIRPCPTSWSNLVQRGFFATAVFQVLAVSGFVSCAFPYDECLARRGLSTPSYPSNSRCALFPAYPGFIDGPGLAAEGAERPLMILGGTVMVGRFLPWIGLAGWPARLACLRPFRVRAQ